jgi:anti-anti-sigma factor
MDTQIELKYENVKGKKNAQLIRFIGDLDATNSDSVCDRITELLHNDTIHIVADFNKLRYVNSTGLGVLLHINKIAQEKGGSFKIANINENVYEIIEIIGATALLEIFESVEDAISALQ